MSVNIKVTGGLNIEWGQIDPKVTGGLSFIGSMKGSRASQKTFWHIITYLDTVFAKKTLISKQLLPQKSLNLLLVIRRYTAVLFIVYG